MHNSPLAGIILAAGKGTRMKSDLPKGLHKVGGLPMVEHVARALKGAGVQRPIVVVGHGGDLMQAALGDGYDYTWQREQLGTGHATLTTANLLANHDGPVVVAAGDTPMLESGTFAELFRIHSESGAKATIATSKVANPIGYGRIVRNSAGVFTRIVEQKDASPAEREIGEVNSGLYCFDAKTLYRILPHIKNTNSQGEYYLTDVLEAIVTEGGLVVAHVFEDPDLMVGVNDRWQLANVDREMRRRVIRRHALAGVTFLDIDTVSVGVDVQIGEDSTIEPNTILTGNTVIGKRSIIGPYTKLQDCEVGSGSTLVACYGDRAKVGTKVWVGPYAHLRPGTVIGNGAKIGNFVEIKNAQIGDQAKVNHLSYVGDATVGNDSNIGAGTITCNYDGFDKHKTFIGEGCFIGSNSTLIAPLTIGHGAFVTAGSVITNDVPADAMAFGRARQETRDGKAATWKSAKRHSKESN